MGLRCTSSPRARTRRCPRSTSRPPRGGTRVRRWAGWAGVAQGHPHSGQQLVQAEGLGQVVVRAQVERRHLVPLLAAGGEDDDGGLSLPDAPDHGQAIDARQAQVEQDDVRAQALEQLQRRLAALATWGSYPRAASVGLTARRSCGSSSTTRMRGPTVPIPRAHPPGLAMPPWRGSCPPSMPPRPYIVSPCGHLPGRMLGEEAMTVTRRLAAALAWLLSWRFLEPLVRGRRWGTSPPAPVSP